MAAGPSTSGSPRPANRVSRGSRLAVWFASIGGTAAAALVLYLLVQILGRVHGMEICAETLERRSFGFLEIPVIGIQIQGTSYVDITGDLEKHLGATNLVPQPPPAKKTWHIIYVARGVQGMRRGDPEILTRYLDARDSNHDLAWLEWTKAHPQLAPSIWKGVSDLAIAGQYTAIPDVLEIALSATDPVQTANNVAQIVKQATQKAP